MLKRTLPGLSEEETKEYRALNAQPTSFMSAEEFDRWCVLHKQIVKIRVGNE
jgi:hypothetical protein